MKQKLLMRTVNDSSPVPIAGSTRDNTMLTVQKISKNCKCKLHRTIMPVTFYIENALHDLQLDEQIKQP